MNDLLRARRLAAAGLLLALACLPASTAAAQDEPRIPDNVSVAGVDVSGLTVAQATATLKARLTPGLKRPVVVLAAGRRFSMPGEDAKVTLSLGAAANAALVATASPADVSGGGAAAGTEIPVAARHSKLAVKAFVAKVAAGVYRAPRDATVTFGLRRQRVHRAKLGIAVDQAVLTAKIAAALDDPTASRSITQRVSTVYPQTNANDLRVRYGTVITVSKAEFKLRVFKRLKFSKSYQVAVGQPAYPTPEGRFSIQDKQIDPVWSVPNSPWAGELGGSTVAGGSAANPLKARWMGITDGVGIHGTGEDYSIGSAASHGCIRMHVADVKDLYPRVPVGTTVIIR
jgi:lipoprotein-anchoring transpeptidase ErfK/SrfK